MKIYGVCDSGYTTPFIQEVEVIGSNRYKSYRTDGTALCFNENVFVHKQDAALSPQEAEQKWRDALLKKAKEFEEKARELRERAKLKLETIPWK